MILQKSQGVSPRFKTGMRIENKIRMENIPENNIKKITSKASDTILYGPSKFLN